VNECKPLPLGGGGHAPYSPVTTIGNPHSALAGRVVMVTREMRMTRLAPVTEHGGRALQTIMVRRCRLILSKPTLTAPGTERLKLTYDELLSSFAFNFNLRRYTMECTGTLIKIAPRTPRSARMRVEVRGTSDMVKAGAYTRPLLRST